MTPIQNAPMMDTLCPMHVTLNATGHIVHTGPTLAKILAGKSVIGMRFLELFELKRPSIGQTMQAFMALAEVKLHIKLREAPRTELKGVLVPIPAQSGFGPEGGAIVNLSFGISIVDAVHDFSLTSADFAMTDLTVEMLYLVEAKSAAMDASRKLCQRLQGAKIAAEEQAFTDTLTGLKNRRAMDFVMGRLIESETDFILMNLDLDYFKAVNDTLGHAAGDYVLQQVARIMVGETREKDTVIRTGGDEFVLLFTGLKDRCAVDEVARRLIRQLEEPMEYEGQPVRISASIGATMSHSYAFPDKAQLMEDADVALYAAKDAGRGCHRVFEPPRVGLVPTAKAQHPDGS
ncbi:MAG: diguanylate cyclase [Roseovarius sp.]